uniref:Uncharacterized protein n=1 Tax=Arundo donax TaxID=35708 RepID=A0A0A8Z4U9_ARUDO
MSLFVSCYSECLPWIILGVCEILRFHRVGL